MIVYEPIIYRREIDEKVFLREKVRNDTSF